MDTLANGRVVVRSPASGDWEGSEPWTLVEEVRIGSVEDSGPELFGYVAGIAVDDLGRIWVLDRDAKELRLFGPDGAWIRTIGREGSGPGEFRDPTGVLMHPAGQVWVTDPANGRYAVFDTSGSFLEAHPRKLSGYSVPWLGRFDTQGRLIERSHVSTSDDFLPALVQFDEEVEPVDTIMAPHYEAEAFEHKTETSSVSATVPYTPTLVWTFDAERGIWAGVSAEYRIFQISFAGDTLREFGREYDFIPVSRTEHDSAVARLRWFTRQGGRVDGSRIPGRKPAFDRFDVTPDGYLWVNTALPEGESGTRFDVFNPEGRYLGAVSTPIDLRRGIYVYDGNLYGVTADSLGVNYVLRLRVAGRS